MDGRLWQIRLGIILCPKNSRRCSQSRDIRIVDGEVRRLLNRFDNLIPCYCAAQLQES